MGPVAFSPSMIVPARTGVLPGGRPYLPNRARTTPVVGTPAGLTNDEHAVTEVAVPRTTTNVRHRLTVGIKRRPQIGHPLPPS
jgi:hypothetical protein